MCIFSMLVQLKPTTAIAVPAAVAPTALQAPYHTPLRELSYLKINPPVVQNDFARKAKSIAIVLIGPNKGKSQIHTHLPVHRKVDVFGHATVG